MRSINPEQIFPLPLGMPFHRQSDPLLMEKWITELAVNKKKDRILANFSPDTPFRDWLLHSLSGHPKIDFFVNQEPLFNYLSRMSSYRYVLSPPGIGYDCFRTWEALSLGCTPIVFKDTNFDMRLFSQLPVWIIDDLSHLWLTPPQFEYLGESIYLDYWKQQMQRR